jgi:hypothetical protein
MGFASHAESGTWNSLLPYRFSYYHHSDMDIQAAVFQLDRHSQLLHDSAPQCGMRFDHYLPLEVQTWHICTTTCGASEKGA